MSSRKEFLSSVVAIFMFVQFSCSNSPPDQGTENKRQQSPGKLELISVEPLPPVQYIENGNFTEWSDLRRAPAGFAPPDEQYASLKYVQQTPSGEKNVVVQRWLANDGALTFWKQFHTIVHDLLPGKTYCLSVRARNTTQNTVVLTVSAIEASDGTLGIERPITKIANVIMVTPSDEFREFTGTFKMPDSPTPSILINVSNVSSNHQFPMEIEWDSWQLTRIFFPK